MCHSIEKNKIKKAESSFSIRSKYSKKFQNFKESSKNANITVETFKRTKDNFNTINDTNDVNKTVNSNNNNDDYFGQNDEYSFQNQYNDKNSYKMDSSNNQLLKVIRARSK